MENNILSNVKGEFIDTLTAKTDTILNIDGKEILLREGESFVYPKRQNTILNSFGNLVVNLLTGQEFYSEFYWEVGTGDTASPALIPAEKTDNGLITPVFRKPVDSLNIHDDGRGIELSVKFGSNEANFNLNEFSIYYGGGLSLSSGTAINRKVHDPIPKTIGIELTRKINFYF